MEKEIQTVVPTLRVGLFVLILSAIAGGAFILGFLWTQQARAEEPVRYKKKPRIIYPSKSRLDFEGADIEGVLQNPAEFYFKYRPEEKFDSLVKRRPDFHREMLRDVVYSK